MILIIIKKSIDCYFSLHPLPRLHRCKRLSKLSTQCERTLLLKIIFCTTNSSRVLARERMQTFENSWKKTQYLINSLYLGSQSLMFMTVIFTLKSILAVQKYRKHYNAVPFFRCDGIGNSCKWGCKGVRKWVREYVDYRWYSFGGRKREERGRDIQLFLLARENFSTAKKRDFPIFTRSKIMGWVSKKLC